VPSSGRLYLGGGSGIDGGPMIDGAISGGGGAAWPISGGGSSGAGVSGAAGAPAAGGVAGAAGGVVDGGAAVWATASSTKADAMSNPSITPTAGARRCTIAATSLLGPNMAKAAAI
jgi:hypothetical protein